MDEKYLECLDGQTLEFIRHTEDFYPPDAVDASIEKQREYYDALCAVFHLPYPEGVSATDLLINSPEYRIPVRHYEKAGDPPKARIMFFHGGGFVVGGLESHDSICAEFCGRTGMDVLAVDYRLAPEHVHPAAFNDCLHAYRHFAEKEETPFLLVGDSAGGTLAASVAHACLGTGNGPIGQLLIYPALGGNPSRGSYIDHANAPMLTRADMEFYQAMRSGGKDLSDDPTASPLAAHDFRGLPPTVIVTAQCDPLADDGRHYRDAISAAGGKAVWFNEEGLVHGYLRARKTVKRAEESVTRMVECLKMLECSRWDFG